MAIPARPEPLDLRLARIHAGLGALCLLALVAMLVGIGMDDGARHLPVAGMLAYGMLLHGGLVLGLRKGQAWAREESIRVAMLLLVAPPFGTVVGVWMLWSIWRRDRRLPRPRPRVPLIEAWPDPDRGQARDRLSGLA